MGRGRKAIFGLLARFWEGLVAGSGGAACAAL